MQKPQKPFVRLVVVSEDLLYFSRSVTLLMPQKTVLKEKH